MKETKLLNVGELRRVKEALQENNENAIDIAIQEIERLSSIVAVYETGIRTLNKYVSDADCNKDNLI